MRKRITLLMVSSMLLASMTLLAQSPLGINYQGIARNADGSPLINQFIGLRISITSGPDGSRDYSEEHHPETNAFGLFAVIIGQGQSSGAIAEVDWGAGNKWLQIEIDPQDNGNYLLVGTQQMMSVPYALYAANSGTDLNSGFGVEITNGRVNNILPDQIVNLNGTGEVVVTGTYPNFNIDVTSSDDADADPTNEIQTLSEVLGQGSDANGFVINNLSDPVMIQDASTKNYVDIGDAALSSSITDNADAISSESVTRSGADVSIKSELDAVELGAGLNPNGTYTADPASAYINSATSLKDSDTKLDEQIQSNSANITSLENRLNATYAFQAGFTINEPAGVIKTNVSLIGNLDDFNQIASNEITIGSNGLYLIVIDAERSNSDANFELLYIRINGVDSKVPVYTQKQNFGRTLILNLIAGDKIRLLATATAAMSLPVNGTISGYKITN